MQRITIINRGDITIDHLIDELDDESEYTGCYEVKRGNAEPVMIEFVNNMWVESRTKMPTELSKEAGELIENYVE